MSEHYDVWLICGGRDLSPERRYWRFLDSLSACFGPPAIVIEGGQRGADRLGRYWAIANGILVSTFEADWAAYGSFAGPRRNAQMLSEGQPGLVVAFPGGRGTANMLSQALAARIRIETYVAPY